jgi:Holliday junction resolvase-like predicted endonuclease
VLEKQVEAYLVKRVKALGGIAYKWRGHGGAADRIIVLPDGTVWFVEVKTIGGRLSALQKVFAADMARLKQKYTVLWTKEQVDEFTSLPK